MSKLWCVVPLAILALAANARSQASPLDEQGIPDALRVWSANEGQLRVAFRREFELPKGVTQARIVFSCDDEAVLYVNGIELAKSQSWTDVTVVEVSDLGEKNVVAIDATNLGSAAALACWVLWTDANGKRRQLVTDQTWRWSTNAAAGWHKTGFDDRKWQPARGEHGSTFGTNVYNYKPGNVHYRSRFLKEAAMIEAALQKLRRAVDAEAAQRALDEIERATIEARARLLRQERARAERKTKKNDK